MRPRLSLLLCLLMPAPGAAEPVTFRVEVPHCTPDRPLFLRSNRLAADRVEHDPLERVDATHYTVTVDVQTPRAAFGYRYSHDRCTDAGCPGIEKALRYDGSGEDLADRALAAGVDETDDLVFVWRSALRLLDEEGRVGGHRGTDERVAFCAPYLAVRGDAVSISVDSYFGAGVVLEWGPDEGLGERLQSSGYRNRFRLSGLEPGRPYFYRVSQDGRAGPLHRFVAPPAPDAAVTLGVVGDIQYYVEADRQEQRRLFDVLAELDPPIVLSAGDIVGSEALDPGFRLPEVGRFNVLFGVIAEVVARAPFMVAMGNHEEDAPLYFDLVDFPHSPGRGRAEHYEFRWGPVHVTVLYTGATEGYAFDDIVARQRAWLAERLAAADADADVAWKIVLLHRGPFSQGNRHQTDGQAFHDAGWGDLWRAHGVDLVVAGHNHNLTVAQHGGIRYLTLCTGAPIHELRADRLPTTIHAEETCAVGLLHADRRALSFTAYDEDGAEIEAAGFELCQPGGCDAPPDAGIDGGADGRLDGGSVDAGPDAARDGPAPDATPDAAPPDAAGADGASDGGPDPIDLGGPAPPALPESDGCAAAARSSAGLALWLTILGGARRRRRLRD